MSAISGLESEIVRVLSEASAVQAAFGSPMRLVEGETARAAFPFIRIARHETRPETPDEAGPVEHRISIEILSRAGGRNEAQALVELVGEALRAATLSPADRHIILFYPVYSDVFLRRDGVTFRGLIRLRALTEEKPD